jgi:predicted dehydrogenase
MKENCSGGALLDLHIHDSDFIQYLFGMPKSVLGITEDVNRSNAETGMYIFLSEGGIG